MTGGDPDPSPGAPLGVGDPDAAGGPDPAAGDAAATAAVPLSGEPATARRARHRRRVALYVQVVALLVLVVLVVGIAVANTRRVELDWLVGSTRASLIWVVLVATIAGWLLGILTAVILRHRTRARRPARRESNPLLDV